MIFGVGGPVAGDATVARATVTRTSGDGAVGRMARGTGVMLFVIEPIDEVRSGGQRCRMAAGTFAVQRDIARRLVIDVMVGPSRDPYDRSYRCSDRPSLPTAEPIRALAPES